MTKGPPPSADDVIYVQPLKLHILELGHTGEVGKVEIGDVGEVGEVKGYVFILPFLKYHGLRPGTGWCQKFSVSCCMRCTVHSARAFTITGRLYGFLPSPV